LNCGLERLVEYPGNPRKNDAAVDRMCGSIREFGFKIPCLARGGDEGLDGRLGKLENRFGLRKTGRDTSSYWMPEASGRLQA
jgi:hypothetical protein